MKRQKPKLSSSAPVRGVALLMVVLILGMLTVIGVLFSLTVSVHLQTNIQYRERAEVEQAGHLAMNRMMAEMMYGVWGTNEIRAFTSGDGTPMGIQTGTAVGDYSYGTYVGDPSDLDRPPVAYFKSKDDPAGESNVELIDRPWARFTESVTTLDHGKDIYRTVDLALEANTYATKSKGHENDFRWMVSADIWGGDNASLIAERLLDARLNNDTEQSPRAVVSGGLYHDEFLPTGISNSDLWEVAAHYNNGTIFGRTTYWGWNAAGYGNAHLTFSDNNYSVYHDRTRSLYWNRIVDSSTNKVGVNAKNWPRDPYDTRIVGNSFYRIFRFDLVDAQDFKVRGTGVDPDVPSRYFTDNEIYNRTDFVKDGDGERIIRSMHLGDASGNSTGGSHTYDKAQAYFYGGSDVTYTDHLGGALNINQINMNYNYEFYQGMSTFHDWQMQTDFYHYNESKWVYLYNTEDLTTPAWARYALYVWPDSGLPNANALPSKKMTFGDNYGDENAVHSNVYSKMAHMMIFNLDRGVGEGGEVNWNYSNGETADGLYTMNGGAETHMGQLAVGKVKQLGISNGVDWDKITNEKNHNYNPYYTMHAQILQHIDLHKWSHGPYTSRAELEMILRKNIFEDTNGELETRRDLTKSNQTYFGGKNLADVSADVMRFSDARILAFHLTTNGYEYTLDPHWEQDRLVFDGHSVEDWFLTDAHGRGSYPNHIRDRPTAHGGCVYNTGGFWGVDDNAQAAVTKSRLFDILSDIRDSVGYRSVATPDDPAQPAMPISAFSDDYSKSLNYAGTYTFAGPYYAKKAKAKFLCTLMTHTVPWDRWKTNVRDIVFAVDMDDPTGASVPNPTPKEILSSGKEYVIDYASGPRISEVGSGQFTVPIGPKLLDADMDQGGDGHQRLLPTRVDDGEDHNMINTSANYAYRYAFETKWMNFIELTCHGENQTLTPDYFLRVYGNVRNWKGEIYGDRVDGKSITDNDYYEQITDNPVVADAANNYRGGNGYIDLFAKVLREVDPAVTPVDANSDGDYFDVGDTMPAYRIKSWEDMTDNEKKAGYDPRHYIEGVVLRYQGTNGVGTRDEADDEGSFVADTNGDRYKTYDRDWRVAYDPSQVGDPTTDMSPVLVGGVFMQPQIKDKESTPDVTYDSGTDTYTDIRKDLSGNPLNVMINPEGTVGDNIPDADFGTPDTIWGGDNGSLNPDGKIDGIGGYYDESNVQFWSGNSQGDYYEDLGDWMTFGKYRLEEDVDYERIDDKFSSRNWNMIMNYGDQDQGRNSVVYRFGSYSPHPVQDTNYTVGRMKWLNAEVKIDDQDYGLEHYGGPEQFSGMYVLVIFPHARTPWTRRGNAKEAAAGGWDDDTKRDRLGLSHFDDTVKYPDVTGSAPRTSHYADGDVVLLGRFNDDHYLRFSQGASAEDYERQPVAITWIKLNGEHPDFADAGTKAGPTAAFRREGATISGGTYIVNLGGGTNSANCDETLPGKDPSSNDRTQTFASEMGRGFAARDIRDNRDPWGWDATYWDWTGEADVAADYDTPYTLVRQSPAHTSYKSRKVDWLWIPDTSIISDPYAVGLLDSLGRGRFDRHVHGRSPNSVFTQMDMGDPITETPQTAGSPRLIQEYRNALLDGTWDVLNATADGATTSAGKGRFPYPIATPSLARVSKSVAAHAKDAPLNRMYSWMYIAQNKFYDRQWLQHINIGSRDMRMRSWRDICMTTRLDEYFEVDSMCAWLGFYTPSVSPVRDMLNNDKTGAPEALTDEPLWGYVWKNGNYQTQVNNGRYLRDRKVVKRVNINEVSTPLGFLPLFSGHIKEHKAGSYTKWQGVPSSPFANKPLRGYTYFNAYFSRMTGGHSPRDAAFWSDNMWADGSFDFTMNGIAERAAEQEKIAWSSMATVAPSPVYTAYILVQKLGADTQPLSEQKIRVTLERTWDGKMHILEYKNTSALNF